jgi:rhamnogalacturonyl hydrolase YesR
VNDGDRVLDIIRKVNDRWQSEHPRPGNAFWHTAAYHTGNMAAFEATGEERYRAYSEAWAEANEWKGARSDNKAEWRFDYGENDRHVLFGDWQACFQTYIDLYNLQPGERKIARAREVMEYQMSTPNNNYWWWADGLYMAMPVMTKLFRATGNELYLQKQYEYFRYADSLMYDPDEGLYYRDGSFVFPGHSILDGKKDFWARGNGWVFAAFAKVLADLPETAPARPLYIARFRAMAEALSRCLHAGGYWTRSLLEHDYAPGPETSGTAFFAYGFQWGINNGLLESAAFQPVADRAWDYLTKTALQPGGSVGYVQPIGAKAIPGQVLDASSEADFGVGAFLLAASERYRYLNSRAL